MYNVRIYMYMYMYMHTLLLSQSVSLFTLPLPSYFLPPSPSLPHHAPPPSLPAVAIILLYLGFMCVCLLSVCRFLTGELVNLLLVLFDLLSLGHHILLNNIPQTPV